MSFIAKALFDGPFLNFVFYVSERYQLHHNNHMSLVLSQLAEDEAFMDVTLTAEGCQVKAHKVSLFLNGTLWIR